MKKIFQRDLIGFTPFYYTQQKDQFFYADNLDTLINMADIKPEPDPDSMYSFLHYGTVAYHKTMYKGIYRLPPAHHMTVVSGKIVKIERYWHPEKIKINHNITLEEAKETFLHLFEKALSSYNVDDPSLVFELSGGLDSSSVVSFLSQKNPYKRIRTVSMDFDHPDSNEKKYVKDVETQYPNIHALHLDMEHIDYADTYSLETLYKAHPHWPFLATMTPVLPMLEALNSRGVKTIVTGLGGDELLQGTPLVMADHLKSFRLHLLIEELKHCSSLPHCIKQYMLRPILKPETISMIKRLLGHTVASPRYPKNYVELEETYRCRSKAFCRELGFLTSTLTNYLIESSYMYWAKETMGITFRHPFYDRELMEFVISLPGELKYRRGVSKYILREAMKGVLPASIYHRTDKATFFDGYRKRIDAFDKSRLVKHASIVSLGLISQNDLTLLLKNYEKREDAYPFPLSRALNLEYWYQNQYT